MAARSYGSGRLFIRADRNGQETWYRSWSAGGRRVTRRIGPKRRRSTADGLTRTQAEARLRGLMACTEVVAASARHTVAEAGEVSIAHLEVVMERKRSTIADYRGYLRRHLGAFFGGRLMDKIDRGYVESYVLAKKRDGLSAKTVCTLVRAVPDDDLGAVERPLYLCAAMTGLRQGELIALRWYAVDWSASRLRVADAYVRGEFDSPKSHRGRSVPMADRLAGALERHFQATRRRAEDGRLRLDRQPRRDHRAGRGRS